MIEINIPLRQRNMAIRRERIIAEARRVIAENGIASLNLRTLAKAADISVPTIYNLIGSKEELIASLFQEALIEIERRFETHRNTTPLDLVAAVVTESTSVMEDDDDYFRSAFLAFESLHESTKNRNLVDPMYQRSDWLFSEGLAACSAAGLLRGQVPQDRMRDLMTYSYRSILRMWIFRSVSIDEFRDKALSNVYITLLADAEEEFRVQLEQKLKAIRS